MAAAIVLVAGGTLSGPGSAAATMSPPGVFATLPVGPTPVAEAIDTTTDLLYVVNAFESPLSVIDEAGDGGQGRVVGTIAVPEPFWVAIDPSNHHLYVLTLDATLVVIGLAGDGGHILATIPVSKSYIAIAADPSNHNVYISTAKQLVVIDESGDLDNGKVTATIGVGDYPVSLAVDSVTHDVYTANYSDNSVSAVDPIRGTVTNIPVGFSPSSVAVDPAIHRVYVTDSARSVSVIDESTRTVTAIIGVGSGGAAIAVVPATHQVYVANFFDNTVSVIDGTGRGGVVATIAVGSGPDAIEVDPSNENVYVANDWDGTVSVIGPPADVTMTVDSPASAVSGSQFSVTVVVTNHGSAPAARTSTDLLIAPGLKVVSAPGAGLDGGTLTWPAQALAAGASVDYHATFSVARDLHVTIYLGGVAICSGVFDPVPVNNSAVVPLRIR